MNPFSALIEGCCSIRPNNAANFIPALGDDSKLPRSTPSPPPSSSSIKPPPKANGTPVSPEVNRLLKDNVKGILINKAHRDMKLGVRLADRSDGSDEGVELQDVHPAGPLASVVRSGDILLRLNGNPCNFGFQHATNLMKEAVGMVELVVVIRAASSESNGSVSAVA